MSVQIPAAHFVGSNVKSCPKEFPHDHGQQHPYLSCEDPACGFSSIINVMQSKIALVNLKHESMKLSANETTRCGEFYHVSGEEGEHYGNTCTCILEPWNYEGIQGVQMKRSLGKVGSCYCFLIREWKAHFGERDFYLFIYYYYHHKLIYYYQIMIQMVYDDI